MTNKFGKLFMPQDLDTAVMKKIEDFFETYMAELEREQGLDVGTIARPRTYEHNITEQMFPGERLPAVVVVSTGATTSPSMRENYTYDAWFDISVAAMVEASSKDQENVRNLLGFYLAVIRTILIQQTGYNGLVDGVMWAGERYMGPRAGRGLRPKARAMAMGVCEFRMRVPGVAVGIIGPDAPAVTPEVDPGDYGIVETAEMHVDEGIEI